ncbi:flagellar hook-associated protein FlgK [Phreatobacter aquaticus]|uniref:Flagellar hook-associated protein 1 n=1 Tax=Phreatobacter aquaticus TaxID=2570229 RepID=A0A4D7QJV7_9HYPH|nr:flagellar hook-associated protein FlgK [Phreatobacter aquaticus]QCK85586.1 flagellar hook-associated protein FlgK [Phreatobacter aquaticus]
MSFSVIRSIAYSSLATSQVQMSVAASNIANADTDGYTRKTATQASVVSGQVGTGVTVTAVTGTVDKYLLKDLVTATSELSAATIADSYGTRAQSLLGSTSGSDDSGTSIANTIADLESSIAQLSGTPESQTLKAVTVDALDSVATQLRETSAGIQSLRADADDAIDTSVDTINDALNTIADLNSQITSAAARGESTADLEDQRNTALQTLSGQMDVTYFVNSDNQMRVYTSGGTTLVDGKAHELSYASASTVTAETVFGAISVDGKDITTQITSGTVGALIDQRDEVLPAAQDELDQLAAGLIDALNAVHNEGTSSPPPSSLTGSASVSSTDSFSASGTTRFAVTDSDGNLVASADLDLSAYSTVGDLASAIDAIDGLSASIDADGHLVIAAEDSSNGVAIADLTASVGSSGQGLADYFGLNDLLTGSGAADIRVKADILATPGLLATAALSTDASLTLGSQVVSTGENGIAASLSDALTGETSFAAAGRLSATSLSFADYASSIVADIASTASSASSTLTARETTKETLANAIASQSGVNIDEETARVSELEQQYSTAAQLLEVLNAMFDALLSAAQSA